MADVTVEKAETSEVEKVVVPVAEVEKEVGAGGDAGNVLVEKVTTTENGEAETAAAVAAVAAAASAPAEAPTASPEENGDSSEAVAANSLSDEKAAATSSVTTDANTTKVVATAEDTALNENGVQESANAEANGDATDSAPSESVKRKVDEEEATKSEDSADITPEKKAKLDAAKEEVNNGAEPSEVAA